MTRPTEGRRTRILVRSAQAPSANYPPLKSISHMGANQGNLLYQFAVCRTLQSQAANLSTAPYGRFERGEPEARAEWINSEFDHLVLPLSSSFRLQMMDTLEDWAALIELLTIPVTIVGIGAQLRLHDAENGLYRPSRVTGATAGPDKVTRHEEVVRRFVAAVLDRSSSLGVRGEITKRYLMYLGFPERQLDVIGCPSLFMWGPDWRMPDSPKRTLSKSSLVSISFDHRIAETARLLEEAAAAFPKSTVYVQEKLAAQMAITGEETRPNWRGDRRFPVYTGHVLYQNHRLVYFPTAWSWIRHLGTMDFAFGPRLHGTVAATLAGTPAHLLIHDSRTLEVAEYHQLPHTRIDRLEPGTPVNDLAARTGYIAFNAAYPALHGRFLDFLTRNQLPNAYDGPNTLREFGTAIAPASKARGIYSNSAKSPPSGLFSRDGARRVVDKTRRLLGSGTPDARSD